MWIGRGFDIDGDGENDMVVVQHLSRADQRAIGKALGVIILAVIVIGGISAIAFGFYQAAVFAADWVQTNSAALKAALFWVAMSIAIFFAILLMIVGIFTRPTDAKRSEAISRGQSGAMKQPQRMPCRKCGHPVTDAFLRCPACTTACPYPVEQRE